MTASYRLWPGVRVGVHAQSQQAEDAYQPTVKP